jgi:hypothetical protein
MQEVVAKLELHKVRMRHLLNDSEGDRARLVYFLLVWCRRDTFTKSFDLGKDGIGRCGPHGRWCMALG